MHIFFPWPVCINAQHTANLFIARIYHCGLARAYKFALTVWRNSRGAQTHIFVSAHVANGCIYIETGSVVAKQQIKPNYPNARSRYILLIHSCMCVCILHPHGSHALWRFAIKNMHTAARRVVGYEEKTIFLLTKSIVKRPYKFTQKNNNSCTKPNNTYKEFFLS